MEGIYSKTVQNVVRFSRDEAIRLGKNYIGAEHLLLGLIKEGEGVAVKILENLKIDLLDLKQKIEESTFPKVSVTQKDIMPLTIPTSYMKVSKCLFYKEEEKKPGTTMQWNKREIRKHK